MLNSLLKPKAAAPAPLPSGILEHDGHAIHASPDLIELAIQGWKLKLQIDALQTQLKAVSEKLQNALGAGAKLRVDGVCVVSVSGRQSMTLTDVGLCQQLLGGRFQDLVAERAEFTLSDKLKEIVLDADHPLSAGLRQCVQVKDSVSVSFRAAAKAV